MHGGGLRCMRVIPPELRFLGTVHEHWPGAERPCVMSCCDQSTIYIYSRRHADLLVTGSKWRASRPSTKRTMMTVLHFPVSNNMQDCALRVLPLSCGCLHAGSLHWAVHGIPAQLQTEPCEQALGHVLALQ